MDQHVEEVAQDAERPDPLPIQEFVRKLGGLERARLAFDTLEGLRDAA